MKDLRWFEILLCKWQPLPFMVRAENKHEAVKKTVLWAADVYPGLFYSDDTHSMQLIDDGFPLVAEVSEWN